MRTTLPALATPFPSVPVMVNGEVPGAASAVAVTVIVEVYEGGVAGLGLKVALMPLGKPEALNCTDPE
jgi:hypothetical protein